MEELGEKINMLEQEKESLKQNFEQDICKYKDKLGQQVSTIQGSMEQNIKQNSDLQDQCMRLRSQV